jgi:hypothetical protein
VASSPESKKPSSKKTGEKKSSGDPQTTAAIADAARRSGLVHRNSGQFQLLKRLFYASQPLHIRPANRVERYAIHRLVKLELLKAWRGKKAHDCCGRPHFRYSITLAGKAHLVAAELGLTFSQLCYLACGRHASRNSVIDGIPAFVDRDVDSVYFIVLKGFSSKATRKELTRKGFLEKRVWHASSITPRFEELEKQGAVLDDLYLWIMAEYDSKLRQAMRDPAISKVVSLFPQPVGGLS